MQALQHTHTWATLREKMTRAVARVGLVLFISAALYLNGSYDTSRTAPSDWEERSAGHDAASSSQMSLQVIAAGLPKTGTATLATALNTLGYNTYHFPQHMTRHFDFWRYLSAGALNRPDWRALYANATAISDHPAVTHVAEIFNAYPQSKVVLTVRDVDALMASMRKHAAMLRRVRALKLFSFGPRVLRMSSWLPRLGYGQTNAELAINASLYVFPMQFIEAFPEFIDVHDELLERLYGSANFNEFQYRRTYERHVAEVKRIVPASQLLIFDVKQHGWRELCEFLGKPMPSTSWLHTNKAGEISGHLTASLPPVLILSLAANGSLLLALALLIRAAFCAGGEGRKAKAA